MLNENACFSIFKKCVVSNNGKIRKSPIPKAKAKIVEKIVAHFPSFFISFPSFISLLQ